MNDIFVKPLSNACGAEISGIDLTKPISPEVAEIVNRSWLEHCVIVIRGQ